MSLAPLDLVSADAWQRVTFTMTWARFSVQFSSHFDRIGPTYPGPTVLLYVLVIRLGKSTRAPQTLEGMLPLSVGLYWGRQSYPRQMIGTPLPCRVRVASPTTPTSDSDRLVSKQPRLGGCRKTFADVDDG